ncbi:hypothetical protein KA005_74730 [bacterium]|nr:hypothetical protein [bacterium]
MKLYKIMIVILTIAVVLLAIIFVPKNLPFWQFTMRDIVILLISLSLVALFIERAVEVIIIVSREKDKQQLLNNISSEKRKSELKAKKGVREITAEEEEAINKHDNYSADTKTIAMPTAFAIGIIISALGFRALQPLVDPAVFKTLGSAQKALFIGIDTLITGALLGGGSKGMHEIVETFLNWVQIRRKILKEKLL